jgi:hypothetical protein
LDDLNGNSSQMYKQTREKCKSVVALLALSFLPTLLMLPSPQIANASTTADYKSPCKYFNAKGFLQANSTCNVKFTTLGVSGGARFIVYFPDGSVILVYDARDGKARTNDIPSDVAIAGGNVVVATEEGEIFIFKTYARK